MLPPRPRDYQKAFFERVKDENLLVVLPTNSGKTLISTLAIQHFLSTQWTKIALFLAPTVGLAEQQEAAISRDIETFESLQRPGPVGFEREKIKIPLYSRCFAGQGAHDAQLSLTWEDASSWERLFQVLEREEEDYQSWRTQKFPTLQDAQSAAMELHQEWPRLFVATPAKMLSWMQFGLVSLEHVCLLVVDECHHCAPDSPVGLILHHFYHRRLQKGLAVPRIMGLTASPLEKDIKSSTQAEEELCAVCDIYDSRMVTQLDVWESSIADVVEKTDSMTDIPWLEIVVSYVLKPVFNRLFPPGDQRPKLPDVYTPLDFAYTYGVDTEVALQTRYSARFRRWDSIWQSLQIVLRRLQTLREMAQSTVGPLDYNTFVKRVTTKTLRPQSKPLRGRVGDWKRSTERIVECCASVGALGLHLLFVSWYAEAGTRAKDVGAHHRDLSPLTWEPPNAGLMPPDPATMEAEVRKCIKHETPLRYMEYLCRCYQKSLEFLNDELQYGREAAEKSYADVGSEVDIYYNNSDQSLADLGCASDPFMAQLVKLIGTNDRTFFDILCKDQWASGLPETDTAAKISVLAPSLLKAAHRVENTMEKELAAIYWETYLCEKPDYLVYFLHRWRPRPDIVWERKLVTHKDYSLIVSPGVKQVEGRLVEALATAAKKYKERSAWQILKPGRLLLTKHCPVKVILFCPTKLEAYLLCSIIRRRCLMRVDWITGAGQNKGSANWLNPHAIKSSGVLDALNSGDARGVIDRFRSTDFEEPSTLQMVIATAVLEEGFDLPTCNLVIRLGTSMNLRQHVQTRGRARDKDSQYVNICYDERRSLEHFRATNRMLVDLYLRLETYEPRPIDLEQYKALVNERTGATIPATQASSVLSNTLRALALSVDSCGLPAEPEMRKWMRKNKIGELDMLVLNRTEGEKSFTIEIPPLRGFRGTATEPYIIRHPEPKIAPVPMGKKSGKEIKALEVSKKKAAAHNCMEALRYLKEQGVLDENWKPPCPNPTVPTVARGLVRVCEGNEAEAVRTLEGLVRPRPRGLQRPEGSRYVMYKIYYDVTTWGSEVLRSGGHMGRARRYYGKVFEDVKSGDSTPVDDVVEDPKQKFVKQSVLEKLYQSYQEGRQRLQVLTNIRHVIKTAESLNDKQSPLSVLQPLALLVRGTVSTELKWDFGHWASGEIVTVRLEAAGYFDVTPEEEEKLLMFQNKLLRFWSVKPLIKAYEDLESPPSHYLLAPLAAAEDQIDYAYVDIINSLSRLHHPIQSCSLRNLRATYGSRFDDFVTRHTSSQADQSTDTPFTLKALSSADQELDPETLLSLLDLRAHETLLVRVAYTGFQTYNYYRLASVDWDKEMKDAVSGFITITLDDFYVNRYKLAPADVNSFKGVAGIDRIRQGWRIGFIEGDRYSRNSVTHSTDICVLMPVTEPIAQQLSWMPSVLWKLEETMGLEEVVGQIMDMPWSATRPDLNKLFGSDRSNYDTRLSVHPQLMHRSFVVPSAVYQTVAARQTTRDTSACHVLEGVSQHLWSVWGLEDVACTDDVVVSFLTSHTEPNLYYSVLPPLPAQVPHSQVLEFHGDALLKYLVSVGVFFWHPHGDEGVLSRKADEFKANAKLREVATRLGLRDHIETQAVHSRHSASLWVLRDKTVSWKQQADVVEALIGAVYWTHCNRFDLWPCVGARYSLLRFHQEHHRVAPVLPHDLLRYALSNDFICNPNAIFMCAKLLDRLFDLSGPQSFIETFTTLRSNIQPSLDHELFLRHKVVPRLPKGGDTMDSKMIESPRLAAAPTSLSSYDTLHHEESEAAKFWLQALHGYTATQPYTFEQARRRTKDSCFQRLEFLGDSAIGLLLTEWLQKVFPTLREGHLTLAKCQLQSNLYLSWCLCKRLKDKRFSQFVISAGDMEQCDLVQRCLCGPYDLVETRQKLGAHPGVKDIGDVYEALVGATLFEFNFDMSAVWRVIAQDFEVMVPKLVTLLNDNDKLTALL